MKSNLAKVFCIVQRKKNILFLEGYCMGTYITDKKKYEISESGRFENGSVCY